LCVDARFLPGASLQVGVDDVQDVLIACAHRVAALVDGALLDELLVGCVELGQVLGEDRSR
jgi:hypothetical protein